MKKRIIAVFITVLILAGSLSAISASAMARVSSDGLWEYEEYEIPGYSKGYTILGYRGTETDVTLPETIDGYSINSVALNQNSSIVNLTIPKCYTCFMTAAFNRIKNLKTVTFSREYEENEITYFGSILFAESKKLQKVVLPNLLSKEMRYSRAAGTEYEAVMLPDGIFQGCKSLKEVVMPENITEISNCAFENCTSLEHIEIPDGVMYLNDGLFDGCTSIRTVNLPVTIEAITSPSVLPENATIILDTNCEYVEQYIDNLPDTLKPNIMIENPTVVIKGDMDGNGEFNINDVTLLQQWIAGIRRIDLSEKGDFDENEKININDATFMQYKLAGIDLKYQAN